MGQKPGHEGFKSEMASAVEVTPVVQHGFQGEKVMFDLGLTIYKTLSLWGVTGEAVMPPPIPQASKKRRKAWCSVAILGATCWLFLIHFRK